jgi:hypothetical protein
VVEPIATGAVAVYLGKKATDGLSRLFGDSADEFSHAMGRFTREKLRNVGRVIENADQKTEPAAAPGAIPSRVAYRILEEGSYSDDEIVVEYLGGVLASSRTPAGRDDRGNTLTALVSRLSTYHLRTHYIAYAALQRILNDTDLNLYISTDRSAKARFLLPFTIYLDAMDFTEDEEFSHLWLSCLYALKRESLIEWSTGGSLEHVRQMYKNAPAAGMVLTPTVPGIELYMWALGKGQGNAVRKFLECQPPGIEGITVPAGAVLVNDFPPIIDASDSGEVAE